MSKNLEGKTKDELLEIKSRNEAELKRLENRQKYLDSQITKLARRERTHRLCTRGAMLEKYLGSPELLTDEQVNTILKIAFHSRTVGELIERFKTDNENTTL